MTATLCGPGGVRAVIAENLLLKQQLIVVRRPRQRAPRLTASDRLLFGFGSLFLSPGRIRKVAIGVRPSTLLAFHQALVRRRYRRLFSSSECPKQSGARQKGRRQRLFHVHVHGRSRADQVAGGGAAAVVKEAGRPAGRLTGGAPGPSRVETPVGGPRCRLISGRCEASQRARRGR